MEAVSRLVRTRVMIVLHGWLLTLQELFASVLLEEGLVDHWSSQVVNHQLEHGLNLLLRVSGVVLNGLVLLTTLAQARK